MDSANSQIFVSGTSYLMPSDSSWTKLSAKHQVKFGAYADLTSAYFDTPSESILVYVMFFLDYLDFQKDDSVEHISIFDSIIQLLTERLKTSPSPLLFCFSEVAHRSLIKEGRKPFVFEDATRDFKKRVYKLAESHSNLFLVNLDIEFSKYGTQQVFDNRNWYFAHSRLSTFGLSILVNSIDVTVNRIYRPAAKVLVLDCDHTLWGGVVGEDGIAGLILGQDGVGEIFQDFQRVILAIAKRGILIALVSKNNENDVWQVFDSHPGMILKKKDISAWRINWEEKSQNIRELANELDLGLDSFVFWDDNPLERERVQHLLPEVETVDTTVELFEWPNKLSTFVSLTNFIVTEDDLHKSDQYRSRLKFKRDQNLVFDKSEYLKSISLNPLSLEISEGNILRAEQLCMKTNQYNLRTQRHSRISIERIISSNPNLNFIVSLKDKYGDHGLAGLVLVEQLDANYAFLDTFLLSCRVLGRYLESWMLMETLKRCREEKIGHLIGEFIPSGKNAVAEEFFEIYNFQNLKTENSIQEVIKKKNLQISDNIYMISAEIEEIPYSEIYESHKPA